MSDDAIKTVAGEITKIAVEHGYNGAAPKTITGAIDALADTLAGSDVDSGQTVAQAVRALAPYIGAGGGGSLGALVNDGEHGWVFKLNTYRPPTVGEQMSDAEGCIPIDRIKLGSQVLLDRDGDNSDDFWGMAASGLTVTLKTSRVTEVSMYRGTCVASIDGDGYPVYTCTSVEQFYDYEFEEVGDYHEFTFTIPELHADEFIGFVLTSLG